MDEQQKQLVAKLKDAQNVLVTVSKNPSVDQLAAAIGLTLALNKLDKHATAVYSGQTPSTIEFLKPEETLESNTDSLRDFIIALDKSKADKLRYKVEDQVVRIFITPYRTSISENDLEFSQGDFNVDVVIALGVKEQTDLDEAISAHGRILHDATVSTVSIDGQSELGTLNITDTNASSLCELATRLVADLGKDILDAQIATALLTGIVAMTDRFSNDRTTPDTMSLSATLMSAGANQQLIANELAEPLRAPQSIDASPADESTVPQKDPGTLEINHVQDASEALSKDVIPSELLESDFGVQDEAGTEPQAPESPQIHVDENGKIVFSPETETETETDTRIGKARAVGEGGMPEDNEDPLATRERMIEPPSRSGDLTANTKREELDASTEELTLPPLDTPMLSHDDTAITLPELSSPPEPVLPPTSEIITPQLSAVETPTPVVDATATPSDTFDEQVIDTEEQTLTDIEKAVGSSHAQESVSVPDDGNSINDARSAVEAALASAGSQAPLSPITALNAQPLGEDLHTPPSDQSHFQPAPGFAAPPILAEALPGDTPADQTLDMPLPASSDTVFQPQMPVGSTTQPQQKIQGYRLLRQFHLPNFPQRIN
ncbi:hypothetical protein IPL68_03420 [Candidatus Saccharibacteria bacterium]|nr:MAG: hypothetical protein IPL68_03420 [Candidatus Saccharibacteria bacterium]